MNNTCKRLVSALMLIVLLIGMSGCGSSAETIREDVKTYASIGQSDEQVIADLFADWDKAWDDFAEAAKKEVTDDVFTTYAVAVQDAYSKFNDAFGTEHAIEAPDGATEEEKSKVTALLEESSSMAMASLSLIGEILSAQEGEGSAERCFESAVELVNNASNFFYGHDRVTEDMMNELQ